MTDPTELIRRRIDDPLVEAFLARHGGPHTIDPPDADLPGSRAVTADQSPVELTIDNSDAVRVVFLHLNGYGGKTGFDGRLPYGLLSSHSQFDVRRLLGEPQFTRPALADSVLGLFGPADRYDHPSHSVHLEYDQDGILVLVTVMASPPGP